MSKLSMALVLLAIASGVCNSSGSAATGADSIARWFETGRCPALTTISSSEHPPVAKRDAGGVILTAVPRLYGSRYFYDPTSRFALHLDIPEKNAETLILRVVSGAPPKGVPQRDLSKARTASGIKLGSSAAAVSAALGTPMIVNACGLERYVYQKPGEGLRLLTFTISHRRVVEIFDYQGVAYP
ncbi:MAG: hypothetical protein JO177_06465 [Candidatus Eremiobacteraeota bacterium]|nr:hypothetical protein [Candidatus Eremiobacteraeota bacterium]